ncbi:MAG: glycosyltransferase family 39 protein, partial [Actinomycetota bacterium]
VGVMYLVARRVWSRRAALIGALALAAYGPLVYFSATFNKESFAIHLQAWLLLALVAWTRRRSLRLAATVGVLAGLGLLVRPPLFLPWLGIVGLVSLFARRAGGPPRRALGGPALAFGLSLLVLVPAAIRNVVVGGAPVLYSNHGWLNLYFANNRDGAGPTVNSPGIAWDLLVERSQSEAGVAPTDYPGINRFWRDRFLNFALKEPGAFLAGVGEKALRVFNGQEVALTNNLAEMARHSGILGLLPHTGWLLPVALVGAAATLRRSVGRRRERALLLLVVAALGLAAAALVFPVTRDRLAPMAVLLLFTGAGVEALIHPLRRSKPPASDRSLKPAVAFGVLAVATLLVHLPLPDRGERQFEAWMTEVNRGDAYLQLWERERKPAQIEAAIRAYRQALELSPNRLQPLKQLPAAYVRAGDLPAALESQQQLVDRLRTEFPDRRTVRGRELQTLGTLAVRAGRPEAAAAAASEWRTLELNSKPGGAFGSSAPPPPASDGEGRASADQAGGR